MWFFMLENCGGKKRKHVDCLESHHMSGRKGQLVNSHCIVVSNEDNGQGSIILTMLINESVTGLESSNSWLEGMEEEDRSKRDSRSDSAMRQSFQKTFFSTCCGQQFPLKQYIKIVFKFFFSGRLNDSRWCDSNAVVVSFLLLVGCGYTRFRKI